MVMCYLSFQPLFFIGSFEARVSKIDQSIPSGYYSYLPISKLIHAHHNCCFFAITSYCSWYTFKFFFYMRNACSNTLSDKFFCKYSLFLCEIHVSPTPTTPPLRKWFSPNRLRNIWLMILLKLYYLDLVMQPIHWFNFVLYLFAF